MLVYRFEVKDEAEVEVEVEVAIRLEALILTSGRTSRTTIKIESTPKLCSQGFMKISMASAFCITGFMVYILEFMTKFEPCRVFPPSFSRS